MSRERCFSQFSFDQLLRKRYNAILMLFPAVIRQKITTSWRRDERIRWLRGQTSTAGHANARITQLADAFSHAVLYNTSLG